MTVAPVTRHADSRLASRSFRTSLTFRRSLTGLAAAALLLLATPARAAEQEFTHRVIGLFAPDRETTLRQTVATLPGVTVEHIDFPHAEVTFRFDPATAFPDTRPEGLTEQLDIRLRTASRSTFRLAPRVPRESLTPIEIRLAGCHCRACDFAAYDTLARTEGVAAATVSFKDQRATALINPHQTNRDTLEKSLRDRGITVLPPP